jgi:hypothetical protein
MPTMRRSFAKHLATVKFDKWIILLKIIIRQFVNKILRFHCGEVSFFLSLGNEAA